MCAGYCLGFVIWLHIWVDEFPIVFLLASCNVFQDGLASLSCRTFLGAAWPAIGWCSIIDGISPFLILLLDEWHLLKCIQLLTCLLLTKVFCFWPWLKMRSAYHTKEVGRCWRCSRRIWVATAFRQQDPAILWTLAVNPQGVFLLGCWLE